MGLFKKDYIIGLDIGASALKLAVFLKKENGSLSLKGLKTEEIADGSSRDAALKKLFSDIDMSNSKIIVSINSGGTMVKRAVAPCMPREELREAIRLEARNYFPFDISDSILDFEELGEVNEKGVKKIEVLSGVSPNKAINEYLDVLTRAGIKPAVFLPQAAALINILSLCDTAALSSIAVLDIGKTLCELVIAHDGKIVFNRRLPVCGDDFTRALTTVLSSSSGRLELSYAEAERIKKAYGIPDVSSSELIENRVSSGQMLSLLRSPAEKLAGEIERSFDFYREESSGMKVDRLILCGCAASLKGLDRFLAGELGIGVEVFKGAPAGQSQAQACAAAVGAGLANIKGINLLPKQVRDEVKTAVKNAGMKAVSSAALTLAVLVFVALKINLNVLDKKIAGLGMELSAMEQRLSDTRDLAFISRVAGNQPYWEDVLKEISNVVDRGVYLKELSFNNQQMVLRGEVVSDTDVQENIQGLVRRLEGGMFKNVRFSRQAREFQIQMEIS